jgi:mycofactocin precursor
MPEPEATTLTPDEAPEPVTLAASEPATPAEPELVEEDLLVEDVSIDGMCGVY